MWTWTLRGEEGGGDPNWSWRDHRDCVDTTTGGETFQGYWVQRSSQETPGSGWWQVGRVLLVRHVSSQPPHRRHHSGLQETTVEQLVIILRQTETILQRRHSGSFSLFSSPSPGSVSTGNLLFHLCLLFNYQLLLSLSLLHKRSYSHFSWTNFYISFSLFTCYNCFVPLSLLLWTSKVNSFSVFCTFSVLYNQ